MLRDFGAASVAVKSISGEDDDGEESDADLASRGYSSATTVVFNKPLEVRA